MECYVCYRGWIRTTTTFVDASFVGDYMAGNCKTCQG